MLMMKSLWGEINLRCFLTVLVVNISLTIKKEFRPEEVLNYFILFNHRTDQNILTPARSKNTENLDWILTDWTQFFPRYIEWLSLSTAEKISTAENRHCQINWNTTTVTDRVSLYPSWKVFKAPWAFAFAQDCTTRLQSFVTLAQVEEHDNVFYIVTIVWAKFCFANLGSIDFRP